MTYAIWWLNQQDCEVLAKTAVDELRNGRLYARHIESLPGYIDTEFWSRYGRAGRNRLWVPMDYLPLNFSIKWKEKSTGAKKCAWGDYGGIIILAEDIDTVIALPGFVTDLNLFLIGETVAVEDAA